jgi:hypothetical protein
MVQFDDQTTKEIGVTPFRIPIDPFPDLTSSEILSNTVEVWCFSIGPFPLPFKGKIDCGCKPGVSFWHVQYWLFHDKGVEAVKFEHREQYRCDVMMKCLRCSRIRPHGVVVPDWFWEAWGHQNIKWMWQDVRLVNELMEMGVSWEEVLETWTANPIGGHQRLQMLKLMRE